jgi:hypothetical protein
LSSLIGVIKPLAVSRDTYTNETELEQNTPVQRSEEPLYRNVTERALFLSSVILVLWSVSCWIVLTAK